MGWRLLHRTVKRGRVSENYEKEYDETYELDAASDFDAFLVSFKKRGGLVVERRNGLTFYFKIDSIAVERRPPTSSGKLQVVATISVSLLKTSETTIAPWELPPYDFRVSARSLEETTTRFYPGVGDLIYGGGSSNPQPLVNTAGARLRARSMRALALVEFAFNASATGFDPSVYWSAQGKINESTTTVCGLTFPPRTIRFDSFNAEYSTESVETIDAGGETTTTTWRFYRIECALLANPRSYDQLFANVGARVLRNGALAQIWRWTDSSGARYGTYQECRNSNASDGEPVADPVSLDFSGAQVSPIATYRVGSPYEPIDFSALALPSAAPELWRVY
ncbi:MAG: hypothetical protein IJU03_00490 [Thermoguttaceae bacterium]|nr:hypothetical protein [Thermoguttaceae bacterium]